MNALPRPRRSSPVAALPARGSRTRASRSASSSPCRGRHLGYLARAIDAYHHGLGPAGHRGKPHRRNGNVGADFVASRRPDGYTMLLSDVGALSINPSVYADMPFDRRRTSRRSSWCRIAACAGGASVVPVANVKELIAYAKANPGRLNSPIREPAARRTSRASNRGADRRAVGLYPLQGRLGGGHGRDAGNATCSSRMSHLSVGERRPAEGARRVEPRSAWLRSRAAHRGRDSSRLSKPAPIRACSRRPAHPVRS